jgi:hypothetical protein
MARAYKERLKKPLLNAFTKCGTVLRAAEAVGVDPSTHREWLKNDPTYAEQFTVANGDVTEHLEARAFQMALAGHPTMLIFLLRSRAPEKYMERFKHEVQSEQLGRLVGLVTSILRRALTQEQIDRLMPEFDAALETLGSRQGQLMVV